MGGCDGGVVVAPVGGVVFAEQQQCGRFQLPANVQLLHDIELAIQFIYDRSPSFRAQFARIAETLQSACHRADRPLNPGPLPRVHAHTAAWPEIRAEIHLPPSSDHAELLAHEFEHILEQIEGLDLRSLARVKDSGVYESEYAVFETDRAQTAGRIVRAETRRSGARAAD